jgi:hypothetical protein
MSMNPFYTSHRIGQLILKRSALAIGSLFLFDRVLIGARINGCLVKVSASFVMQHPVASIVR